MKSWELTNGYRVVQVLQGRANAYVVCTGRGNLLVDTGLRLGRSRLVENIGVTGPGDTGIEFIILTHTHFDHCANAAFIRRKYGCTILLHENEARYAASGDTPLPAGTTPLTKMVSRSGTKLGKKITRIEPFSPVVAVTNRFSLKSHGYDAEILETPGHTAGSVSVVVNNEIAIVGDTLYGIFKRSVFPPYADDPAGMVRSWGRLLDTGCRLFLPGHGSGITRELLHKEYEAHRIKPEPEDEQKQTGSL